MKASVLKTQMQKSPLLQQKRVHAVGAVSKGKGLLFAMNLTTLIDAFCILVIFLLSNMSTQVQQVEVGKNMTLPAAELTEIMSTGVVVRLEENEIYVEDKKIATDDIVKVLIAQKSAEKSSLIIQADKNSDYEKISILLRAGGQAGYEKYAFAVLPGTFAGTTK